LYQPVQGITGIYICFKSLGTKTPPDIIWLGVIMIIKLNSDIIRFIFRIKTY